MKRKLPLKNISKGKRKSGIALIELIVYMTLSLVVLYIASMMLFFVLRIKKDNLFDEVRISQSRITFLNIERSLNLWSGSEMRVNVQENTLTIEYPTKYERYKYYFYQNYIILEFRAIEGGKLVYHTYELGKKIENLRFYKKENLIYVDIKINSKEEVKRCFAINQTKRDL